MDKYPEVTEFFQNMTRLPLEKVTAMVPPGGAGVGMHVIPVEKAIEHESQSVSLEHLSYWLKKYDYYEIGVCSCRNCESRNGHFSVSTWARYAEADMLGVLKSCEVRRA